ncbi:allergin-1 isoform X2 [Sciurus carolinensis]|uniref:allergin-1 isoform X2 n=1 Tax=Sciurus carolinensis TaxID=30640 RepID=UPI001FB4FD90|nr:allergin-1 isoform X2 [Sciurus carolinensis]
MWRHLNVLFWGIFSSVTFQKAVPTCSSTRTNEFSSPSLNSNTNSVVMGQNVSLLCSHKNRSLDITYFLFLNKKFLVTKTGRGKPVTFNLTISSADDLGPYKCKATVVNCSSYSAQFNFTVIEEDSCPICPLLPLLLPGLLLVFLAIILVLAFWLQQKYKARKAMRQNVPKDSGDIPMEGDLYVNIYKTPAGTGYTQEIHYATPGFEKVVPGKPETCRDCNTDYTYSELTF